MQVWTSVTTTNSPAWYILSHARHLVSQGATRPIYFLDKPEMYSQSDFENFQKSIRYIICNERYWGKLNVQPRTVPEKQMVNLKVARTVFSADWFLHIDSDEFLHLEQDFFDLVSVLPADVTEIRLQNFERVMRPGASTWHTGSFRMPCWDKSTLATYPSFIQPFLALGLANYYHGKSFVKNRSNLTQGIHGASRKSTFEVIRFNVPWSTGFIGHYQYTGRDSFYRRFTYKRQDGEALLKHEIAQVRWMSENDFARDEIFRLAQALFEADDVTADGYRKNGLFRDIPREFIKRIENSFQEEHLLINA